VPLHFGDWLGVTPPQPPHNLLWRFSKLVSTLSGESITRNTGEFAVELRPPTLERFFDRPRTRHRYKHTIEPTSPIATSPA